MQQAVAPKRELNHGMTQPAFHSNTFVRYHCLESETLHIDRRNVRRGNMGMSICSRQLIIQREAYGSTANVMVVNLMD
jgi:hypothetical protein